MKILIIDDDLVWQMRIKMMLDEIGYKEVNCCASIDETIAYLNVTDKLDLIITDIVLGDEIIFELKSTFLIRKIPCIFITASPIENNYEQTRVFANTRFLVKPFHTLSLRGAIDDLMIGLKGEKKEGVTVTGKLRQKIIIKYDEILWLEAGGNYTTINTIYQKKHTIKKALLQMAKQLDARFIQVERGIYINTEYINRIELSNRQINLKGNIIKIGRAYRNTLIEYVDSK
jgi:DNA-binding LytR/AlgR family response regulator